MKHMDEGLLQAYVDEELTGEARVSVERHLGDCLSCRSELRDLRSAAADLSRGLLLLDGKQAEARQYAVVVPNRAPRSRWGVPALGRAAVLVLGLGTAAAAMVPGSPLYRWIRPAPEAARVERTASAPAALAATATAAAVAPAAEAGVSIEPLNGEVRVVLRGESGLRIRAAIGESPRAGVFATGAAADARFETGPGRIEVTGADSGELRIEIPATAITTVSVNGRDYLRAEGGQIHLSAPAEARAQTEVTFHP